MFKAKHLREIQAFMEKTGIPGRDGWELPLLEEELPRRGELTASKSPEWSATPTWSPWWTRRKKERFRSTGPYAR